MPDGAPGRVLTYSVPLQASISRPSFLSADAAWDCHFCFVPYHTSGDVSGFDQELLGGGGNNPATYSKYHFGGTTRISGSLIACKVASGDNTFDPETTAEYEVLPLSDYLEDQNALLRLSGGAFKVENVTESLHKSGAVTCYTTPQGDGPLTTCSMFSADGSTFRGTVQARKKFGPPTTLANAKLFSSITMKAEEGAMVHLRMNVEDNHPVALTNEPVVVETGIISGAERRVWMSFNSDNIPLGTAAIPNSLVLGFDMSGAYFTGLSYETKLEWIFSGIVESHPTAANSLITLANDAPPYDAKALQCYSEIIDRTLSGYPASWNSAGSFFRKALSIAKGIADTAIPVVNAVVPSSARFTKPLAAGIKAGVDIERKLLEDKNRVKDKSNRKRK